MAIKVLIKRKFKTGSLNQASQLLNRARYSAMGMKGYISSETLTDLRDPHRIVVVSMWHSIEDWNNWKTNPSRSEFIGRNGENHGRTRGDGGVCDGDENKRLIVKRQ